MSLTFQSEQLWLLSRISIWESGAHWDTIITDCMIPTFWQLNDDAHLTCNVFVTYLFQDESFSFSSFNNCKRIQNTNRYANQWNRSVNSKCLLLKKCRRLNILLEECMMQVLAHKETDHEFRYQATFEQDFSGLCGFL